MWGANPCPCNKLGIWCSGNDILALRNARGAGSSPAIPMRDVLTSLISNDSVINGSKSGVYDRR